MAIILRRIVKKEEETFLSHFLFIFIVDAAFSVDETEGKSERLIENENKIRN
jgi:hypothetical protein